MWKKYLKNIIIAIISILTILFVVQLLYRYTFYPGEIRKECAEKAKQYVQKKSESRIGYSTTSADIDYKFIYRNCFQENGLRAEE